MFKTDEVDLELITSHFGEKLENTLQSREIQEIKIIVAFLTIGGAEQLLRWLQKIRVASHDNVDIKVLTGTYLDFTHPGAIQLLQNERDLLLVRVLDDQANYVLDSSDEKQHLGALHAKAYFIRFRNNYCQLFIGSSNLTIPALYHNIEWNSGAFISCQHPIVRRFLTEFNVIWNKAVVPTSEWLSSYKIQFQYSNKFNHERLELTSSKNNVVRPRVAQRLALEALQALRQRGEDKALIVMATGLGKTHLAAFDSLRYKRVLFVAHRKEILNQALKTFKDVRKIGQFALLEDGWFAKEHSDVLFATVQKLSRSNTLKRFSPDEYDYIIIDEFHHAQAKSYKRIIEYFEPMFLLGLTATPFRMDRKDISELCDRNIPFIASIKTAIEKGWLSTFDYYGIQDTTLDYTPFWSRQKKTYDIEQLTLEMNKAQRAELILKHYHKHQGTPTIGFCISIAHADYMARFFNDNGVKAVAVHSGSTGIDPSQAKSMVRLGQVEVIFAVDVFNEGIDLPEIKKVMLLRPTESPTIFIQQVGRGLRKTENKEKLIVLDFIGNYHKFYTVPALLTGQYYSYLGREFNFLFLKDLRKTIREKEQAELIKGCHMHFDLELIEDMINNLGIIDVIRVKLLTDYQKLEQEIKDRPTLMNLADAGLQPFNYITAFGSFWEFLKEAGKLTEEEQGYSKKEISVLAWLENVFLPGFISLTIIEVLYETIGDQVEIFELETMIYTRFQHQENLDMQLQNEVRFYTKESINHSSPLSVLIREIIQARISAKPHYKPGWTIKNDELIRDMEINWDMLEKEIRNRIQFRREMNTGDLELFRLYTRKNLRKIFLQKGATENLAYWFGPRSPGIIYLESLNMFIMLVTLDKSKRFHAENVAYNDYFLNRNTMIWESQNSTTLNSKHGKIIQGKIPARKLMFIRLRGKDKHYGNAFFYVGEVEAMRVSGEKPITVEWRFKQQVPHEIYQYLTDEVYRKYEYLKQEG